MISRFFILQLGFFLGGLGCASHSPLLEWVESPESQVPYCVNQAPLGEPRLGPVLESLALDESKTHAILLEEGASAIVARAWLSENATESIDAQYFIFSADNVGVIAVDTLLLAAERGTRVRLLVDDTLSHGDPDLLKVLALHPNADVRIYNPNLKVGVTRWEQAKNIVQDFRDVNQRMHNKLFIADGKVAITGGRNVSSEYFDLDNQSNFRDRDVLLMHGAVDEAALSFETFWNHELAVSILDLMGEELEVPIGVAWRALHEYACNPRYYSPEIRERVNRLPESFGAQMEEGRLHAVDDVHYVWDLPGKNESDGMWGGGITTTTLIELVRRAKSDIVIQTPYLVTTELGQGVFREAIERGVRVRILTNSLSVTDNVMAFSGYKRSREALLETGVEVYELKPDPRVQETIMNGPIRMRMLTGLAVHAKSMVIDGEIALVGSFNLDPRSANLNTEVLALFHSVPMAQYLLHQIEREMRSENSWRTTLESNPDRKAPFYRRVRLFFARIVPKSVL